MESRGIVCLKSDDSDDHKPMAIIDVEDLVGANFEMLDNEGTFHDATIAEVMWKHTKDVREDSTHVQFCVSRNKDDYEDIITHNELLEHIKRQGEDHVYWELHHRVSHQSPLNDKHPSHKVSTHNIRLDWENRECIISGY